MRSWVILPLLVFLGLAGWYGMGLMLGEEDRALPSALLDRPVPEFALPPLRTGEDGLDRAAVLALAAEKGPLLVNVFASWCLPCRAEHPLLMQLQKDGVTILGLNQKDAPENGRAFLKTLGDPYARIGADRDGKASIEWGVYGVPETFVVDRKGVIRHRHVGALDEDVLRKTLRPLLDELRKAS